MEGLRLTVVQGDTTNPKTQAIVLPSDSSISLSGMVGQVVSRKAGPTFTDEINRTDKTKTIGGNDNDDDNEESRDEEMEEESEEEDDHHSVPTPESSVVTMKMSYDSNLSSELPSTMLWVGTLNDEVTIRDIADNIADKVGVLEYSTAYFKVTKKEMIPHSKGIICIGSPTSNNNGGSGKLYRTGKEARTILDIGEGDKKKKATMITPEHIPSRY